MATAFFREQKLVTEIIVVDKMPLFVQHSMVTAFKCDYYSQGIPEAGRSAVVASVTKQLPSARNAEVTVGESQAQIRFLELLSDSS